MNARVDPITLAVVRNNLISIANGMQETGFRTGVTTFMYEIGDCCFAILDPEAGVIAQSHGMLLFLGSLGPSVKNCLDLLEKNLEPGDVLVCNVPEITGSHTSDAVLFTPIFFGERLFGYAATKAHWIDLGAKGTYPTDALSIFEEGLRIPPTKLYRRGNLQREVWQIIRYNSRAPEEVWGDMQAQISGCRFAETRVLELLDKYGFEVVNSVIRDMYDHSERVTRAALEAIPDGCWSARDFMDSNGIDRDRPVHLQVTVTKKGSDITVDLSGSDPQQPGPLNGLWVTTLSAARAAIKALTTPDLPANEGCNRPVSVIAPPGCVYNAGPATPSFLSGNVAQTILELVNQALYKVLPDRIPAGSGGDVVGNGFFGVDPQTGSYWGTIVPSIIGQGADYERDGDGYVMFQTAGASQNIPSEVLETAFPLFVEKVEFVPDSGGAGKQRGGLGSRIRLRLLAPASFYSFIEKGKSLHWGLEGGQAGLRNFALVESKDRGAFEVMKTSGIELAAGDRVAVTAGGGGGYGRAVQRDPELVLRDVVDEYVSLKSARDEYGVVIDPDTLTIDWDATRKLRAQRGTV